MRARTLVVVHVGQQREPAVLPGRQERRRARAQRPRQERAARVAQARGWTEPEQPPADRQEILDELDAAAAAEDMTGWMRAAERFLSNLTVREQVRTGVMLELLMNEQMSSMERARRGNG